MAAHSYAGTATAWTTATAGTGGVCTMKIPPGITPSGTVTCIGPDGAWMRMVSPALEVGGHVTYSVPGCCMACCMPISICVGVPPAVMM